MMSREWFGMIRGDEQMSWLLYCLLLQEYGRRANDHYRVAEQVTTVDVRIDFGFHHSQVSHIAFASYKLVAVQKKQYQTL
jgi:hypothetical protein